jgi:hypothetical protein
MVLDNSKITVRVAYPDLGTPISSLVTATIDPQAVEIDDIADFASPGRLLVHASFDFSGADLTYALRGSGGYADAPGAGFNGYKINFAKLADETNRISLHAVDIVAGLNTFSLDRSSIRFDRDSLFLNMDAVRAPYGSEFTLRLGFAIDGTGGANKLRGDAGRDKLSGFHGDDRLSGGDGADTLNGGRGADTLIGGLGRDTFILREGSGNDLVTDFQNGIDRVEIATSDNRFGDLTIVEVEAGVRIRSDGASILLRGADLSDINAADFIF